MYILYMYLVLFSVYSEINISYDNMVQTILVNCISSMRKNLMQLSNIQLSVLHISLV